jgi:hypothetical protein
MAAVSVEGSTVWVLIRHLNSSWSLSMASSRLHAPSVQHAPANTTAGITNGTALGYEAVLNASNSIVLGNTAITKIYAEVSSITTISDRRRKKDIRALDSDIGLDFIEKLEPVSYRFNNGDETERCGFIAQDLEQALPGALHDSVERSQPEHGLALIERQNDKDRTYRVAYGELTASWSRPFSNSSRRSRRCADRTPTCAVPLD